MMALSSDSSTVDFYRKAIDLLLVEMGNQVEERKIDELHGQILRLTSRMADAAFNDIRNRTKLLAALVADLRRIIAAAANVPSAAEWTDQVTAVLELADTVVNAATGGSNGNPA